MDAENEFLKEFICCYQMQRCLWDVASPEYMLREIKMKAYDELMTIMKRYKADCNLGDVKKKINTIRSSFRRELKKIKQSESSGAGVETVYKPKIWWFEHCSFLQQYERPTEGISSISDEDTRLDTCSFVEINDGTTYETPCKTKPKSNLQKEAIEMAMSYLQKESDSFEHLGLAWAEKIRKMQPTQSKLAERLISEILFQGDMEMLTLETRIQSRKPSSTAASTCYSRSSTPYENSSDMHLSSIDNLSTNFMTYSAPSSSASQDSNTRYTSLPIPNQTIFVSCPQILQQEQIENSDNYDKDHNIRDYIFNFKE